MNRRVKAASFREQKTLEDFDWQFNPSIKKKPIYELATCQFIHQGKDVLLLAPGDGKSHLAKPSAIRRSRRGCWSCTARSFDVVRDFLHERPSRDKRRSWPATSSPTC